MKKLVLAALALGVFALAYLVTAPFASAATTDLFLTQTCDQAGRLTVRFDWRGNSPAANQQWLDLSLANNDWAPGSFLGAGPLPPTQQRLDWTGLVQGTTHYVRLNQLLPDGTWDPSPTFYFATGICPNAPVGNPTPPPSSGSSSDRVQQLAPIDDAQIGVSATGIPTLIAKAGLPGGCAQPDGYDVQRSGTDIKVRVYISLPAEPVPCTAIYGSFDVSVPFPDLTPGNRYHVDVNGTGLDFTA